MTELNGTACHARDYEALMALVARSPAFDPAPGRPTLALHRPLSPRRQRKWADWELALVRKDAQAGRSAAATAARLGRSRHSVTHARRRLAERTAQAIDRHGDELRRLHGLGLSDLAVKRLLGVSATTVKRMRDRLGLPPNLPPPSGGDERQRRNNARLRRGMAASRGFANSGQWLCKSRRCKWAALCPFAVSKAEVAVARALARAGEPLTVSQVAAAAGVNGHTARYALYGLVKCNWRNGSPVRVEGDGRPLRYSMPQHFKDRTIAFEMAERAAANGD